MMEYKGYVGKVEFDDEAGIFHGEVLDTQDVITFQGRSVDELKTAFQGSIDDYLAFCKQRGEEPNKPFSASSSPAFRRSFIARSIWRQAFPARASMPGSPISFRHRRPHQVDEGGEGRGERKAEVETGGAARLILPGRHEVR